MDSSIRDRARAVLAAPRATSAPAAFEGAAAAWPRPCSRGRVESGGKPEPVGRGAPSGYTGWWPAWRSAVLLALVVDDAHLLDAASARFLLYLARRIGSLPVVLIVAMRPGGDRSESAGFSELAARVLALAPLSMQASATVVAPDPRPAGGRGPVRVVSRRDAWKPVLPSRACRRAAGRGRAPECRLGPARTGSRCQRNRYQRPASLGAARHRLRAAGASGVDPGTGRLVASRRDAGFSGPRASRVRGGCDAGGGSSVGRAQPVVRSPGSTNETIASQLPAA